MARPCEVVAPPGRESPNGRALLAIVTAPRHADNVSLPMSQWGHLQHFGADGLSDSRTSRQPGGVNSRTPGMQQEPPHSLWSNQHSPVHALIHAVYLARCSGTWVTKEPLSNAVLTFCESGQSQSPCSGTSRDEQTDGPNGYAALFPSTHLQDQHLHAVSRLERVGADVGEDRDLDIVPQALVNLRPGLGISTTCSMPPFNFSLGWAHSLGKTSRPAEYSCAASAIAVRIVTTAGGESPTLPLSRA
jgi:hypothetical protein